MKWIYDLENLPAEAEEVLVVLQNTGSGLCCHMLARLQWRDGGDDVSILTWQATCDGTWLVSPFTVYGWARFPSAVDRSEADPMEAA